MRALIGVIILLSVIYADSYIDLNPKRITKKDLRVLKDFDLKMNKIYNTKHKRVDINRVYNFILSHKAMINTYNKMKSTLRGEVGSRTRRASLGLDSSSEIFNKRNYYSVSINFQYPLFDKKTEKRIINERIIQNNKIIDLVIEYASTITNISIFKEELNMLKLIQIRDKALVKKGIKFLEERIKTIERIQIARANISRERVKRNKFKLVLLNLTTHPKLLRKML